MQRLCHIETAKITEVILKLDSVELSCLLDCPKDLVTKIQLVVNELVAVGTVDDATAANNSSESPAQKFDGPTKLQETEEVKPKAIPEGGEAKRTARLKEIAVELYNSKRQGESLI